jgi:hypothetical protein
LIRRGIHHPLTPVRQAWRPTPEQVEGGIVGISIEEAVARKPRKTRSKAEQVDNPYESTIQRRTIKLLKALLHPDAIVQAVVSEHRNGDEKLKAKLNGQEPGWPDIGIHFRGREWVIEMKDANGRKNADQIAMHKRIKRAGTPLLEICRSPEEAVAWLETQDAPFRGRIAV